MIDWARRALGPYLPQSFRVFGWKMMLRIGFDRRGFLLETLPEGSTGAEVGVWQGDFSARILATVRPVRLHLIDPWMFNPAFPARAYGGGIARSQRDMDAIYQGVIARFADRSEVEIHRQTSLDAVEEFSDESLDWIYIDGDHSEEAVYADMAAYFPKIKPGGLITGDDYDWVSKDGERAVKKAVDRFLEEFPAERRLIKGSQFVLAKC